MTIDKEEIFYNKLEQLRVLAYQGLGSEDVTVELEEMLMIIENLQDEL